LPAEAAFESATEMANKLVWAILGGTVLGAAFGYQGGNTAMGIAICIVAGAVAAGVWHWLDKRRTKR
jgi:Na+/citrate or Na+/malate symporter